MTFWNKLGDSSPFFNAKNPGLGNTQSWDWWCGWDTGIAILSAADKCELVFHTSLAALPVVHRSWCSSFPIKFILFSCGGSKYLASEQVLTQIKYTGNCTTLHFMCETRHAIENTHNFSFVLLLWKKESNCSNIVVAIYKSDQETTQWTVLRHRCAAIHFWALSYG